MPFLPEGLRAGFYGPSVVLLDNRDPISSFCRTPALFEVGLWDVDAVEKAPAHLCTTKFVGTVGLGQAILWLRVLDGLVKADQGACRPPGLASYSERAALIRGLELLTLLNERECIPATVTPRPGLQPTEGFSGAAPISGMVRGSAKT